MAQGVDVMMVVAWTGRTVLEVVSVKVMGSIGHDGIVGRNQNANSKLLALSTCNIVTFIRLIPCFLASRGSSATSRDLMPSTYSGKRKCFHGLFICSL